MRKEKPEGNGGKKSVGETRTMERYECLHYFSADVDASAPPEKRTKKQFHSLRVEPSPLLLSPNISRECANVFVCVVCVVCVCVYGCEGRCQKNV